jgi:hypothetical protein
MDKMKSQQPVKPSNMTIAQSGTVFFNKGSIISASEGIIVDSSGSIPLSVWQEPIKQLQEGQFYTITACSLCHYYGERLTIENHLMIPTDTQEISLVSQENTVNTHICCPDILSVSVITYPICNNKACRKKINPIPGAKFVKCLNCNRDMLLENAYVDMNINFHLQRGDKTYSVTAFYKVISSFLGEDIYCYKEDNDPLIEKLLLLKNVDFYLSPDQKLVIQIKEHYSMNQNCQQQLKFKLLRVPARPEIY